jgi:hypothetical protein
VDQQRLHDELVELATAGDPVTWMWLRRLEQADADRPELVDELQRRLLRADRRGRPAARGAAVQPVDRETAEAAVTRALAATPERCWRCDAAPADPAEAGLGLCRDCADDLRAT